MFQLARTGSLLAVLLILGGCQLLPFYERQPDDRTETQPPTEHRTEARDPAPPLEGAMRLLQDGREDEAESLLEQALQARPDDAVARLLLSQIRQPPEVILGDEYTEIEIEPGDSLSAIAARYTDNELLFYALARLNGIERPRLLRPGQTIRVPVIPDVEPQRPAVAETPAPNVEDEPGDSVVTTTVGELVAKGRLAQAHALLLSKARANRLEDANRDQLVEIGARLARVACRNGEPERASAILDQTRPWIGSRAETGEFATARAHVNARLALIEARQQFDAGDHDGAFESLARARSEDEAIGRDHPEEMVSLEAGLVDHYHDRALSAWRDQEVDAAVALWQKVVQVSPDFEPARVYLDRALRVQQELERLEEG
jgi:tetratricopeptide (TPR) repeat protein